MGHSLAVIFMVESFDGGVSKQAVKQLFDTVKSLCAAVGTLTNNMKQMIQTVSQSYANPVNPIESVALRLAIREEVREMVERVNRKSSIVVKSLEVPSGREFVEVFEDV